MLWQDWTNVVIGLWLSFSPWLLLSYSEATRGMIANCVISGMLIAGFAWWALLSGNQMWQEWVVIAVCLWLLVSWRLPYHAPGNTRVSVPRITGDNVIVALSVGAFALWSLARRKRTVEKKAEPGQKI